jgi:hypothetical protein
MDRDHLPGGKLWNEAVLFHEDGHLIADSSLKIAPHGPFLHELIANVFAAAYIRKQRPDLKWVFENPAEVSAPPRYTSLFDLQYAGGGDPANYVWYQRQLERLADFLVKDQQLPALIEKFEREFPFPGPNPGLEGMIARLDAIRPGFSKELGPLTGPSQLLRIAPEACQDSTNETRGSLIVVQNDTGSSVDIVHPDGHKLTVAPQSVRTFSLPIGSSLKLPDNTCLRARDESSLAVLTRQ